MFQVSLHVRHNVSVWRWVLKTLLSDYLRFDQKYISGKVDNYMINAVEFYVIFVDSHSDNIESIWQYAYILKHEACSCA